MKYFLVVLLFVSFVFDSTVAVDFNHLPFTSGTENDWEELLNVALKWNATRDTTQPLNPLILIPGLVGSNLNVKLTNAKSPLLCSKNSDWELLWLNIPSLARPDCFFYNLGQTYNSDTQDYSNNVGVEIDVVDFGGVDGVSYLGYIGNKPVEKAEYMLPLIQSLESVGYVVGENLAAAPYDWRKTANPNGWNDQIKELIETMYANNENRAVFVLAHSMGNLEFTSFLNTMTEEWKNQYIAGFLSAAGPWSGSSLALRALISGLKIGLIDPFRVASEIRSFGSVIWMLPDQFIGDFPLVVTPTASYAYGDIPQLLSDIGATQSLEIYDDVEGEVAGMANPNVPIYCLYGTNKETELWYEYGNGLFDQPTLIHYETAGDGIVPLASLQKCQQFNPLDTKEFNLLSHTDLIKDPIFFNYIINIVNPQSQ